MHGLTGPDGPVGGGLPAYGFYEARGGWVALAAIEPHFQARLREELGLPELERDALARAFRVTARRPSGRTGPTPAACPSRRGEARPDHPAQEAPQ